MSRLQVRNWDKYQHYKNRRPPWIKVHQSLLDNMEFCSLPISAKAMLPLVWLIASESKDGTIPADSTLLAFRLRLPVGVVSDGLSALIGNGFLVDASGALADRLHDARPEGETEGEGEGEKSPSRDRESTYRGSGGVDDGF